MSIQGDPVWPVQVRIGNPAKGGTLTVALMNHKAFRKSRETGTPWVVHPLGGRVLPWPGEPKILRLENGPGRFSMDLDDDADPAPYGIGAPPEANPDDRSAMNAGSADVSGGADGAEAVMRLLAETIAERRRTMPEGSYTTHLFEKGLDKIRKKTGEEAVELLLARDDQDLVYESADLVYHLLVLLEASDLSWSDVTAELARRHAE